MSPTDGKITAFSTWSLSKLAEHPVKQKVTVAISRETLRRMLRAVKVSWKTTTAWKASTDPDFIAEMHRILALYDAPPTDGRVICVDEFGPLNLMPRKGKAWGLVRRPRRLRATYNRHQGVMHMLAALDLALDNFSPHKHAKVRACAVDHQVEWARRRPRDKPL